MSKVLQVQVCAIMQKHFPLTRSPSLFLQNHGYKTLTANNPMYDERPRFLESSSFLMDELKKLDFRPSIWSRYKEMFEYNVFSPTNRLQSIAIIYMYRKMKNNYKDFTEDKDIEKLYIVAWCADIYKAWTTPWDDFIDNSRWRRGQEAWAFRQSNPLIAIYDLDFLRETIYKLIYAHFDDDKEHCLEIFKTFQRSIMALINQQEVYRKNQVHIEANRGKPGSLDLMQRHIGDEIIHYAIQNYMALPCTATLKLTRTRNDKLEKILSEVHENIARIYEELDDLADIYVVDPTLDGEKTAGSDGVGASGKECTDIRNGDYNQILLGALEIASPEQKRVLELNWGMNGDKHEQAVRKVFADLDMERRSKEKIANLLETVKKQIELIPNDAIRETESYLLDAVMVKNDENFSRS